MKYIAYTRKEGAWPFTISNTPFEAQAKLIDAIKDRSVLCIPVNNEISYILVPNDYNNLAELGRDNVFIQNP